MKKKVIEVSNIKKSYDSLEVLKGVSFTVEEGQIFALLGSNGAGKTTMINILTTLLRASQGSAKIGGYDIKKQVIQVKQMISLTGQFSAVDEILTGRENLMLMAKLRHISNPQETVEDLLARFNLVEAAKRRVTTYSGGMKRRLDIAMSLIGNPKVIFLDEPTTGLDPEARQEVYQEIKQLAKAGVTILLTTQYLEEAEVLADRIAILHNGTILEEGTLSELKQLFPPIKKEYIEKQPTLEEIFLSIINTQEGSKDENN